MHVKTLVMQLHHASVDILFLPKTALFMLSHLSEGFFHPFGFTSYIYVLQAEPKIKKIMIDLSSVGK